jgi:hypothetical protein
MKIGLVGESPNDTVSIQSLLSQIFPDFEYVTMIRNLTGAQLEQVQPTKSLLRIEYQIQKPDVVVFVRDLDGLPNDQEQIRRRKEYFAEFRTVVDNKALPLLIIYEIEAYILAHIDVFNQRFNCQVPDHADPTLVKEPKEVLKSYCKRYAEGHNAKIFEEIDAHIVMDKCASFAKLVDELKARV